LTGYTLPAASLSMNDRFDSSDAPPRTEGRQKLLLFVEKILASF
jgi:hypothetical protein